MSLRYASVEDRTLEFDLKDAQNSSREEGASQEGGTVPAKVEDRGAIMMCTWIPGHTRSWLSSSVAPSGTPLLSLPGRSLQ